MATIRLSVSDRPDKSVFYPDAHVYAALLTVARCGSKTKPHQAVYRVRYIGPAHEGWRRLEAGILTDLVCGGIMRNSSIHAELEEKRHQNLHPNF